MFKFRHLTSDDFPLMLEWLSREHVKQWWNDGDDTLEKVARHYGEKDGTKRFILVEIKEGEEKPIGYFQYYFASDNLIGIDQFIADETYLNRGIGTKTIKMFVGLILRKHEPSAVILDPSPENKRAVRCYEKVGFKHFETKRLEDGSAAYMMRLDAFTSI